MVLWTVVCIPLLIIPITMRLFGRVASMRWGARVTHVWARGMLRLFGVRLEAQGPRPPAGAFLVSNHTTWLDILVISAWQPTNFIAKKEVAQIPAIGFLSGFVGTLFLDRERRRDAHRLALEIKPLIAGGLEITLFPEGYCADGHSLLPFRPALFGAAAELDTPCLPIAVTYDLPEVVWNDGSGIGAHTKRMLRARQQDRGHAPIHARVSTAPARHGSDRKLLARVIEEEVRRLFKPFAPPAPQAPLP